MAARIHADYWIETAYPLEDAAAAMAGEQSTGTFIALPGETPEIHARHGARVERIEPLDEVAAPSLPGAGQPDGAGRAAGAGRPDGAPNPRWRRARVELSWPLANLGPSLPMLVATVAGNLFELKQFSGMRLIDIRLPEEFANAYPGPAFGIAGTRRVSGVAEGPLIGTIVKPSVGLDPAATAALVTRLAEAGIDFIKDDELQGDGPHCPFDARVTAVMAALDAHAQRTGKRVLYAFNITGECDAMRQRHDRVLAAGGGCVMVSVNSIGLAGLSALRAHSQLPIHAHRNGWGALSRCPALGFDYTAWHTLWRLAGADHMHVNGLRNKFCEPDESVLRAARACLTPLFDAPGKGYEAMPVFSSGQWAGQAFDTYAALGFASLGSADLIYACGGGIMAHPGGAAAGVASIREAWEAAAQGLTLAEAAAASPAIRAAVERFGP